MRDLILAPSILAADFSRLGELLAEVKAAGARYIHVDVMDGRFVPNITVGAPVLASLRANRALEGLVFDAHLMVEAPEKQIPLLTDAGADIISFHVEAARNTEENIREIKRQGKAAGLVVNPKTPVETVFPHLRDVDMVLIMSVEAGEGGQEFLPQTLEKARKLRSYADKNGFDIDIEMDGGINSENVKQVIESGVNVIVAGTAIFRHENAGQSVNNFLRTFNEIERGGK